MGFKVSSAPLQVILVRVETSAEDVGGMHAAEGILTARGGMTSHAAVVARGWGKPCVCGVDGLQVSGGRLHASWSSGLSWAAAAAGSCCCSCGRATAHLSASSA